MTPAPLNAPPSVAAFPGALPGVGGGDRDAPIAATATPSHTDARSAGMGRRGYLLALRISVMRLKNWSSIIRETPPSIRWPTLAMSPPI